MTDQTTFKRFDDWFERLVAYLDAARDRPFAWGEHDCALAWTGAVEAMTGVRPYAEEIGRYSTRGGAYRRLKRCGFEKPADAVAAIADEIPVPFGGRGDCGILSTAGGECVLTIVGPHAVGPSETGWQFVPTGRLERAFRLK